MNTLPQRYILRSRQVVTPQGTGPFGITISHGRIVSVDPQTDVADIDLPIVAMDEYVIMPGLVDTHVHINEPGRTEWEGFTTATQAAAAGGITTLVDMPLNCIPVITTVEALQIKRQAAQNQLWVDCGLYGGLVPGSVPSLEPLINEGVPGFKAFLIHSGIDDFPQVTEADLRQAMPILAKYRVPLLVHAEMDCHSAELTGDSHRYNQYLASRPRQWELDAIALMIRLCGEFDCPVHIVHLSCADALPMIRQAKAEGLPLTVETCPHYLTLHAETVPHGDTRFKCAPPIREKQNAEALWQGLLDGTIDFIVSDHSPCTPELKRLETGDFQAAWGGISALQLGLPLIWTEMRMRQISVANLAQWMAYQPAKWLGLHQKGRIAPGADADIVVWDPKAAFRVTPDILYHRHKLTPYEGKHLYGKVVKTMLRGQWVYEAGQEFQTPQGRILQWTRNTTVKGIPV